MNRVLAILAVLLGNLNQRAMYAAAVAGLAHGGDRRSKVQICTLKDSSANVDESSKDAPKKLSSRDQIAKEFGVMPERVLAILAMVLQRINIEDVIDEPSF